MKPLVSIIVPVYNVSNYIEECLNSLTNQTLKKIEIIVVDDCGTDDSIIKAQKIADKDNRIKIIHNKENQGLGESRNIGLKYVKADYVSFLDSDDWVAKDFCEKLYHACHKENADIAVSDFIYWYSEEKQTRQWVSNYNFMSGKTVVIEPKDKQYNIYACSVCGKLFNIKLFHKYDIKFPKGLYYEDVPVTFFTTVLANKLVIVKDTSMLYRQRERSIMATTKNSRKPFHILDIYEYILAFLNSHKNIKHHKQYMEILENFAIFNVYGYYLAVNPIYRDEFWEKMRAFFMKIHCKHNYFLTSKNRKLYEYIRSGDRLLQTSYIKLFDLLPLFKYQKTEHSVALYLFNFIPLYIYKHKII